jgi:molybdenum cofactor cytidylyltransferase
MPLLEAPSAQPANGANSGALILLAAGRGTRFGSDKRQQAMATGVSLLATTLQLYQKCYARLVVVLRPGDEPLEEQLREQLRDQSGEELAATQVVYAEQAAQGMGHSLACGARALLATPSTSSTNKKTDSQKANSFVTVALADMPYVRLATLRLLQHRCTSLTTPFIVQPTYQDKPGNPVAFSTNYLQDFTQLQGDQGARAIVRAQRSALHLVAVEDPGVLQDIDRPQDIQD